MTNEGAIYPDLIPVEAILFRHPVDPCEWAEQNYYFATKDSATAGYWNRSEYNYSEAPLRCLIDDEVDEVVMNWATQIGKTSILNAMAMFVADQFRRNVIIVCPDEMMAREHYDTKLEPALEQCSAFRGKLLAKSKRQKGLVRLPESWIMYAWTGSATTVSGRSAPVVLITEVNLASKKKSDEGDRVQMARDRTKGFDRRMVTIVIEGKPTIEGECRITEAYERSNQQTFQVPCPICGEYQELVEGGPDKPYGLKWSKGPGGKSEPTTARHSAYYRCIHCEGDIAEQNKVLMLRRGVWCPAGQQVNSDGELEGEPDKPKTISGFHMSSLYSSVLTWGDYAYEYLRVKDAPRNEFRAFVNGWRCKPWKLDAHKVHFEELREHCENYKLTQVPSVEVLEMVMTVDTQGEGNGLWWVVRAWGTFGSSWLINYGFVQSFDDLETVVLPIIYRGPKDRFYRVNRVLVDSGGHRTEEVYQWCSRDPYSRTPVKGAHQYTQKGVVTYSTAPNWGIPLWNVDAGIARDELYEGFVRIPKGEHGFWSLPEDVGEEYLRGVSAWERREERDPRSGRKRYRWHSKDPKNEHLGDCEVYQMAAMTYYRVRSRDPKAPIEVDAETDFLMPDGRRYLITER